MSLLASLSKSRLSDLPRLSGVIPFAEEVVDLLPDNEFAQLCHETAVLEFVPIALERLGRHADAERIRGLRGADRKTWEPPCAELYNVLLTEKPSAPADKHDQIETVIAVLRGALHALDYWSPSGALPNFMQCLRAFERLQSPGGLAAILGFYRHSVRAEISDVGHVVARTRTSWALLREDPDGLRSFVGERAAMVREIRQPQRDRMHLAMAGGLRNPDFPVHLEFPEMWRRPINGTLSVRVLFIGNFAGVDNVSPLEDVAPKRVTPERWAQVDQELKKQNKEGEPSLWSDFHRTFERFDATLPNLQVHVLPATRNDLWTDMEDCPTTKKSGLYRQLHTAEFGGAGGKPYSVAFVFAKIDEGDNLHQLLRLVAAHSCLPMFINGKLDVADDLTLKHYRRLVDCPSVTGYVLHRIPAMVGNGLARYGMPVDVPQLDPDAAAWILGARVAQHLKVLHRHWMSRRATPYSIEADLNAWLSGFVGEGHEPTKPFGRAKITVGHEPEDDTFPFTLELSIQSGLPDVQPRQTTVYGRLDCE